MRRLRTSEEGATAIFVALVTIALFGFGALALDGGQLYQERRELQNGADGAVLAAAYDCAKGLVPCTVTGVELNDTIDSYANANANDNASSASIIDLGADYITVETETVSDGNSFLTHWLAGVMGHPTSTLTAQATAAWGVAGGGATLPLTFSWCEWSNLVPDPALLPSTSEVIYFHDGNPSWDPGNCVGPAGQDTPGGFGWLEPDGSGDCQAQVNAEQEVDGDTGNSIPSECDSAYWDSLVGQTVMIPIFTSITGTGSNATYYIEGFAGFVLEGYRLSGNPAYNTTPSPCNGDERCISGYFTEYVAYDGYIDPSGTYYGATVVALTR